MTTEAGAPSSAAPRLRRQVPWDWTDVLIFVAAAFVVAPLGLTVFEALARVLDGGLSTTVRSAVQSFAGASGIYVSWVAVILGLVIVRRRGHLSDLGWRRGRRRWVGLLVLILVAVPLVTAGTLVVATWLAELSTRLFPSTSSGQCTAVRQQFGHVIPVAILLVSVIDPLAEETIFRGFIYGWLRKRMPVIGAVAISAAIFSLAHFDLLLFLPLFGVGAILACVYELSDSLIVSALVHGGFNAFNVVALLNAPSC